MDVAARMRASSGYSVVVVGTVVLRGLTVLEFGSVGVLRCGYHGDMVRLGGNVLGGHGGEIEKAMDKKRIGR